MLSSPLHEAAAGGESEESIFSGLYTLVAVGCARCCQLLVDAGAVIDRFDCHYGTPLHAACFFGHLDAAVVLLGAGAHA